ncbi:MAG: hypothetical protein WC449_01480 [Candidatus Paceibacterota bacterium]
MSERFFYFLVFTFLFIFSIGSASAMEASKYCISSGVARPCPLIINSLFIGAYENAAQADPAVKAKSFRSEVHTIERAGYTDTADSFNISEEQNIYFAKLPAKGDYLLFSIYNSAQPSLSWQAYDEITNLNTKIACAKDLDGLTQDKFRDAGKIAAKSSVVEFVWPKFRTNLSRGDCFCRFQFTLLDKDGRVYAQSVTRPLLVCENPPKVSGPRIETDFASISANSIIFRGNLQRSGGAAETKIAVQIFPEIELGKFLNAEVKASPNKYPKGQAGYAGAAFFDDILTIATAQKYTMGPVEISVSDFSLPKGYCYGLVATNSAGKWYGGRICGNNIYYFPKVETQPFDYGNNKGAAKDEISAILKFSGFGSAKDRANQEAGESAPGRVWFEVRARYSGAKLEQVGAFDAKVGQKISGYSAAKKQGDYCYRAAAINKAGVSYGKEICIGQEGSWPNLPKTKPIVGPPSEAGGKKETPPTPLKPATPTLSTGGYSYDNFPSPIRFKASWGSFSQSQYGMDVSYWVYYWKQGEEFSEKTAQKSAVLTKKIGKGMEKTTQYLVAARNDGFFQGSFFGQSGMGLAQSYCYAAAVKNNSTGETLIDLAGQKCFEIASPVEIVQNHLAGYETAILEAKVSAVEDGAYGWFWVFKPDRKLDIAASTAYQTCQSVAQEIESAMAKLKAAGKNEKSKEYKDLLARYDVRLSLGTVQGLKQGDTFKYALSGLKSGSGYCAQARIRNFLNKTFSSAFAPILTQDYEAANLQLYDVVEREEKFGQRIGTNKLKIEGQLKDNGGDGKGQIYALLYESDVFALDGTPDCNIELRDKKGRYRVKVIKGKVFPTSLIKQDLAWDFDNLEASNYYCYQLISVNKAGTKYSAPKFASTYLSDKYVRMYPADPVKERSAQAHVWVDTSYLAVQRGYKVDKITVSYGALSGSVATEKGCKLSGSNSLSGKELNLESDNPVSVPLNSLCVNTNYTARAIVGVRLGNQKSTLNSLNQDEFKTLALPPQINGAKSSFKYFDGDGSGQATFNIVTLGGNNKIRYKLKLIPVDGACPEETTAQGLVLEAKREYKDPAFSGEEKITFTNLNLDGGQAYCAYLAAEPIALGMRGSYFAPGNGWRFLVLASGPRVSLGEFDPEKSLTIINSELFAKAIFDLKKTGDKGKKLFIDLSYVVKRAKPKVVSETFHIQKEVDISGRTLEMVIPQRNEFRQSENFKFIKPDDIVSVSAKVKNSSGVSAELSGFTFQFPNLGAGSSAGTINVRLKETSPSSGYVNYNVEVLFKPASNTWTKNGKTAEATFYHVATAAERANDPLCGQSMNIKLTNPVFDEETQTISFVDTLRQIPPRCKFMVSVHFENYWKRVSMGSWPNFSHNGYPSTIYRQVCGYDGGDCIPNGKYYDVFLREPDKCGAAADGDCPMMTMANMLRHWYDSDNAVRSYMFDRNIYKGMSWSKASFVLNGGSGCNGTIGNLKLINDQLTEIDNSLPFGRKTNLQAVSILPSGDSEESRSQLLDEVYRRALSKGIPASVRCCRSWGAGQHFFLLRDVIYRDPNKKSSDDDLILIADSSCSRGNAVTRRQYLDSERCGQIAACRDGYSVPIDVIMYWLEKK